MSTSIHTVRIDKMDHIVCDGTKLAFRMHTADQWHKDVHLSVGDAGKFVALILSELVRHMPPVPNAPPTSLTSAPIPARGFGQATAPDGAPILAVDMGLMQLVFALPPSAKTQA